MIMTSFHQNQSPPISGVGEGAEGMVDMGGGGGMRRMEGPGEPDPLQGRKGGKWIPYQEIH